MKILTGLAVHLILAHLQSTDGKERTYTVGLLYDSLDENLQPSLQHAVDRVNTERWFRTKTKLAWSAAQVTRDDSFAASKKVCSLLKNNVGVVIGPQSAKSSSHVQSICQLLQIPHIEMREDFRAHKTDSSVNIAPHPKSLSRAFAALIDSWAWYTHFSIIYEDVEGLARVQELLKLPDKRAHVYQLDPGGDYRPLLKRIKISGDARIVLECRKEIIPSVFQQAQQLGMINEYYDYIITNLDLHTLKFEDYYKMTVNITGFQLIDPTQTQFRDILFRWKVAVPTGTKGREITAPEHAITTEVALLYDAVLLYARALADFNRTKPVDIVATTPCDHDIATYQNNPIIGHLRTMNITGLTGPIHFNSEGFRTNFDLSVIKLLYTGKPGFRKIATWSENTGVKSTVSDRELQRETEASLAHIKLTFTTIMNPPFFMNKTNADQLSGNDRYEGYIVDLVEALAKEEGFTYTIRPVADKKYGDDTTGSWNGMIGELINKQADIAAADLTITQKRQDAVDFTIPFMHLGISILYKKSEKKPTSLFYFLTPLSEEVWVYMATAYLGVSVILFILARFSPYEWDNPHPCKRNPDILENVFSLTNSMWFTIGSLMQQGWDFAPKAISTRMVACVWGFFTLIMISSYTANLAAFLTSERMLAPITSAEDLVRQSKIKYGCMKGGSTQNFFSKLVRTKAYMLIPRMLNQPVIRARVQVILRVTKYCIGANPMKPVLRTFIVVQFIVPVGTGTSFPVVTTDGATGNSRSDDAPNGRKDRALDFPGLIHIETRKLVSLNRSSQSELYKKMWTFMDSAEPTAFANNNDEGVGRVRRSNYAFFMESTVIEYHIARDCGLMQIGGLLDSKGYGIATPKDSPHRAKMNRGVLALQDKGVLLDLKRRWWEDKSGPRRCSEEPSTYSKAELGIANVGGVFVLLMGGMGVACIIGILEFVWNTRKTVRENRDSVCNEMAKELKFALSCSDSTKPAPKSPSEPENGLAIPLTGYGGFSNSKEPLS